MEISAQIVVQINASETESGSISQLAKSTNVRNAITLTTGTGANQAQVAYSAARTIAIDSTQVLDLADLNDSRGTLTFTAIKALYIKNTGTVPIKWIGYGDWDTGPQKLPDASEMEIPAGGIYLATNPSAAGWTVGASAEYLTLENQSVTTAATYDVVMIGEGSIT